MKSSLLSGLDLNVCYFYLLITFIYARVLKKDLLTTSSKMENEFFFLSPQKQQENKEIDILSNIKHIKRKK